MERTRFQEYFDYVRALTGHSEPLTESARVSLGLRTAQLEGLERLGISSLTPFSFIECPDCGKPIQALEWKAGEAYCEDHGEHGAIVCPTGHILDLVYNEPKILEPEAPYPHTLPYIFDRETHERIMSKVD